MTMAKMVSQAERENTSNPINIFTEKYLSGGFSNRLTLAIKSTLPNEQDWALNKLIKLTYQHQFYIGYLPGLPEALLDLSEDFFGLLRLNTSPKNFETSLVDGRC
jgi:hypothetical protein